MSLVNLLVFYFIGKVRWAESIRMEDDVFLQVQKIKLS
jgi:hypothetical protein